MKPVARQARSRPHVPGISARARRREGAAARVDDELSETERRDLDAEMDPMTPVLADVHLGRVADVACAGSARCRTGDRYGRDEHAAHSDRNTNSRHSLVSAQLSP